MFENMEVKTATLEELTLLDVPCGFDIKYYAADDPTNTNDLWWHVYSNKPIWNESSRCWETLLDGSRYEIGTYECEEHIPFVMKGLSPESSLIKIVSQFDHI